VKKRYTADEWAALKRSMPVPMKLGRKHRNYGNSQDANPYEPSDPRHEAWLAGWYERDNELLPKG
jgi:ribosome modulation factor